MTGMPSRNRPDDPADMTPRQARDRYIDRHRTIRTESTIETYESRLRQFVWYCENEGIDRVSKLTGWDLEGFETELASRDLSASSVNNRMWTVLGFIEYLERVEAVEDGLSEKVNVPDIPEGEESDDTQLPQDRAQALIRYYRRYKFGSLHHVVLEILWHVGPRLGGVRALDVQDYDSEDGILSFRHRPESDTPLKRKKKGERLVAISPEVCDAIDAYLSSSERHDVHDDYGRRPLLTSREGRPVRNTVRVWCYYLTFPCVHTECPHEKDPATCEYRSHNRASSCPSSRSPHQIRTGSITFQLNRGLPIEVVAKRVNSSEKVIKKHYDKATEREKLEERRRPYIGNLEISDNE